LATVFVTVRVTVRVAVRVVTFAVVRVTVCAGSTEMIVWVSVWVSVIGAGVWVTVTCGRVLVLVLRTTCVRCWTTIPVLVTVTDDGGGGAGGAELETVVGLGDEESADSRGITTGASLRVSPPPNMPQAARVVDARATTSTAPTLDRWTEIVRGVAVDGVELNTCASMAGPVQGPSPPAAPVTAATIVPDLTCRFREARQVSPTSVSSSAA
jgi:hypothetical protein